MQLASIFSPTFGSLAAGESAIKCMLMFICTCSITATIVCIFGHVQWRWALDDVTARG
jgi:hypothetical protein